MKKTLLSGFIVFCLALFCPLAAFAEQSGIYVAPKFIFSHAVMNKIKGSQYGYDTFYGGYYEEKNSPGGGDGSDEVFGGSLAVGYDFSRRFALPIRAELEYSLFSEAEGTASVSARQESLPGQWGTQSWDYKQTLNIQTLFLNAYYDIKTGTPLTPYIGAGVGFACIGAKGGGAYEHTADPGNPVISLSDGGTSSSTKSVTNFAWNVGAGVGWDLTERFTLDLGYRFAGLGDVGSASTASYDWEGSPAPRHGTQYIDSEMGSLYMHQVSLGLRYTF